MAKSMRSKRKQRLRSLRREIAEPFYEKKEAAKLAAQQAALEAPKLPVRVYKNESEADVPAETSTAMGADANLFELVVIKCMFSEGGLSRIELTLAPARVNLNVFAMGIDEVEMPMY
ncbi:hypothetical protein M5K25_023262 [Dendrobium thyrsiflorum]|uniref:Uncharacterized protein n=1 Tax=Dendrobium thyrsiflorum TaxID=117978 RepID=A0ABD0U7Q8_DENTH